MFHVPHDFRILNGPLGSDKRMGNNGAFYLPPKLSGRQLWSIASNGYGWEHVSVHVSNRTGKLFMPTWDEMCYVKEHFWDSEDVVMQLHPAKSRWINNHPTTLHLWRPTAQEIPTPPDILVGIKGVSMASQGGA